MDDVVARTPASKAGFQYDDLIVEFDGKRVHDADKLRLDIGNEPPGTKVSFKVIRNGKERDLVATLGTLDTNKLARGVGQGSGEEKAVEEEFIEGVEIADLTPRVRALFGIEKNVSGVFIQKVSPYSPAAENGLESGDIITGSIR